MELTVLILLALLLLGGILGYRRDWQDEPYYIYGMGLLILILLIVFIVWLAG